MKALLVEREDDLLDALAADLGKPRPRRGRPTSAS